MCISNPPNIIGDDCHSLSLMTSTISPTICVLPTSLKSTIGSSSFSSEFQPSKWTSRSCQRQCLVRGFSPAFMALGISLRDRNTSIGVSEPQKGPAEPSLNNKTQLLHRSCSGSLSVGFGTLVSEIPPSSYPSSLCSLREDMGVQSFPLHQVISIRKEASPGSSLLANSYMDIATTVKHHSA